MGIQKALAAFFISLLGVLNAIWGIDLGIGEETVTAIVAGVISLLTAFGVWKVTNKVSA